MKTNKNSKTRNFKIDMDMYTYKEAIQMLDENDNIFYLNDEYEPILNSHKEGYLGKETLRINHCVCTEVKVIYNKEFGEYMNIVKTIDNNSYYINL